MFPRTSNVQASRPSPVASLRASSIAIPLFRATPPPLVTQKAAAQKSSTRLDATFLLPGHRPACPSRSAITHRMATDASDRSASSLAVLGHRSLQYSRLLGCPAATRPKVQNNALNAEQPLFSSADHPLPGFGPAKPVPAFEARP